MNLLWFGMLLIVLSFGVPVNSVQAAEDAGEFTDGELQIFKEAVRKMRSQALFSAAPSTRYMIADMLRTYVQTFDPYADYLTSGEYAAFLRSAENDYFGVQMDIRKKGGVVYVYPFPKGIAAEAGIRVGDELVAIDGMPVYGTSIYLVGAKIRGENETTVQLTMRTGGGIPRIHTLIRQQTKYRSISLKEFDQACLITISRFIKDTGDLLGKIIASCGPPTKPFLIDLRGNQGGSLAVARQCADYFVDKGAMLYSLRTKCETVSVRAETASRANNPVIILQDEATASAAEAFTAALVQNNRAVSLGRTSYGKGLAQRFLPLSDGSALLLSYAEIITPCGMVFNEKGLEPLVALPQKLVVGDFSQDATRASLFVFIKESMQDLRERRLQATSSCNSLEQ